MGREKNERVQPIADNIVDVVEAPAIDVDDSSNNRTYAWLDRARLVVKEMSNELGKSGRMKVANLIGLSERSLRRDISRIVDVLEDNDQNLSDYIRGEIKKPLFEPVVDINKLVPEYDSGDIVMFEYGENGAIQSHTCITNSLPENYKDAQNAMSLISLGSLIVNGYSQEEFIAYLKDCGIEKDEVISTFGIQDVCGYNILKLKLSNGDSLVPVQNILESLRRYVNYITGGNFVIIDTEYATQLSINYASAQQSVEELNKELDIMRKNNMRLLAWLTITAILAVLSLGSVVLGYFSSYQF